MKLLKPKFWDQNYFTVASLLLLPLSFLYKFFLFLRKKIYSQKRFPIKIICVGNIYVGGTGKTPIVLNIWVLPRFKRTSTQLQGFGSLTLS